MPSRFDHSPEFQSLLAGADRPASCASPSRSPGTPIPSSTSGPISARSTRWPSGSGPVAEAVEAAQGPRADQLGALRRGEVRGEQGELLRPAEQLPERGDRPEDRDPDQPLGPLLVAGRRGSDCPSRASTCRPTSCCGSPTASSTLFIDPFHSGELLDRQGCERGCREVTRRPVDAFRGPARPLPGADDRGADAPQPQGDLSRDARFPVGAGRPAPACRGRRRRSRGAARPRHDLPPARPHRRGHRPAPVLPRLSSPTPTTPRPSPTCSPRRVGPIAQWN